MPYTPHEVVGELPDGNTVIWRFMNLPKFLSMMKNNSLYFCQLAHLRSIDPFEGTLSKLDLELHERMQNDPESARALKLLFSPDLQKQQTDMAARHSYVNCWNMCEDESAFLWSVYASQGEGIAIRSTIGKLISALEKEPREIFMGKVKYTDFRREYVHYIQDNIVKPNYIAPIFHKRKSFEAERELRVCFLEFGQTASGSIGSNLESGFYIHVDLAELIDKVYMPPTSPDWYSDAVLATMQAMGLHLPHEKSSLFSSAIF